MRHRDATEPPLTTAGEMLYRNATDCYKKVYRNEGLLGFYRGASSVPKRVNADRLQVCRLSSSVSHPKRRSSSPSTT